MRSIISLAVLAAIAAAQDLDWDIIANLPPLPTPKIPVVYVTSANAPVATALTLTYSESAILASVSAALSANTNDVVFSANTLVRRDISSTSATTSTIKATSSKVATSCRPQPTGAGPVPSVDSASAFLAYAAFADAAKSAPTPSGYKNTFTNLQKSNNAYGYLGFTTLTSYDTQACANKCTKMNGCRAFNIYYERDPSQIPDSETCSDPKSTTQIKCVLFGGPVSSDNAVNSGQRRNKFQVVIAGSNGYVNQSLATPIGYDQGFFLDDASINAPLDCNGANTYLRQVMFTSGAPFDADLCASACSAQNAYAHRHGLSALKTCHYFNTYILYRNGAALGQNCALYSESWNATFSNNKGYYYNKDHYTIGSSFYYSNKTDAGVCKKGAAASSSTTSTSTSTTSSSTRSAAPVATTSGTSSATSSSSQASSTSFTSGISSSSATTTSPSSSLTSSSSSLTTTSDITSSTTLSTVASTTSSSSTSSFSSSRTSTTTTSITSSSNAKGDFATTSLFPAAISDSKAPKQPTITPDIFIPTTTDINGILPGPSQAINFVRENSDDTTFTVDVNITVHPDVGTIVNMEKFIPFITSATCGSNEIELDFTTQAALQKAVDNWPSKFVLLTSDGAHCGDGSGGRSFYNVSSVTFDQGNNVAKLTVVATDITTVASKITTSFGTKNNTAVAGTKRKRTGKDGSTGFWLDTNSFTSFAKDFVEGFNAGYDAVMNLNPHAFDSILNPHTTVDNRVQCPDCGLRAYITLFGGYDWNWGHANFNYINAGFMVQNADLNVAFEVFGTAGYSLDAKLGLDKIELPGIGVPGLLSVSPTVSLEATAQFELVGGGFNVANLGVGYHQQDPIFLSVDFANRKTSQYGWHNLAPQFLDPIVESIPSELSFRGSIGPVFGIEIKALTFKGNAEIGLDTPYVDIDVSLRDSSKGLTSCTPFTFRPINEQKGVDVKVTTGIEVNADFSLSALVVGQIVSKSYELYSSSYELDSFCWAFDGVAIDNTEWAPGFS